MQVGDRVFVRYVHDRLLLAHYKDEHWAVATPDFDLYIENLEVGRDFADFQVRRGHYVPVGLGDVYGFDRLAGRQSAALQQEGRDLVAEEIARQRPARRGAAAAGLAAAGAADAVGAGALVGCARARIGRGVRSSRSGPRGPAARTVASHRGRGRRGHR